MDIEPIVASIGSALGTEMVRTRFAPSPTGYLHLGHVVNALYVWKIARALQGKVILRLENHDLTRCKPEFEAALLEDLEWLGFIPDEGMPAEFRAGLSDYRQSDCSAHYLSSLEKLQAQGLVYACDCSRKRILARTQQVDLEELRYDGHCRDLGLKDGPGMTLRLRVPDLWIEFEDVLLGKQVQYPGQEIGDFALRDNHGHWTYQFAVVVDDIRHRINLIVRGMDILTSTGRQIILAELLGQVNRPIYLHHPLLVDAHGRKLSKRDFATDIHQRKMAGESAESLILEAVRLAGFEI
jgi:glutamyl-Q tRNA(Asp) synthetase